MIIVLLMHRNICAYAHSHNVFIRTHRCCWCCICVAGYCTKEEISPLGCVRKGRAFSMMVNHYHIDDIETDNAHIHTYRQFWVSRQASVYVFGLWRKHSSLREHVNSVRIQAWESNPETSWWETTVLTPIPPRCPAFCSVNEKACG